MQEFMQFYEKVLYQESRTGCHSFRKIVINSFVCIYKRFQSKKTISQSKTNSVYRTTKMANTLENLRLQT